MNVAQPQPPAPPASAREVTTASTGPRRFDAPVLDGEHTLRVVARHDATAQRRRFDAGFQQGYADGQTRGAAAVDEAIADHRRQAERLESLCVALERALASVHADDAVETRAIEAGVVDLSVRIAESVIGREATDHDLVLDTIRQALQIQPRRPGTTIAVHPDDFDCVREAVTVGLTGGFSADELVSDPNVSRGGCVVEAGGARLDSQVDSALERVRDALDSM